MANNTQMAKEKKEIDEVVEESPKGESDARREFKKIMKAYKERNPVKYELKEAELEKKLTNIK